ncbi:MAG: aldehyde dehydrogenase family protein, partial [Planctomycetota bacterium]
QLRQAAKAAEDQSWASATIDTATGIRSMLAPIGPVAVFGPNNFPLAFNGIAGGDFAAAIAAGNPVIAKANPGHPGTTRLLAVAIQKAADATNMPSATVQMIYRMGHAEGERLVSDPRLGAVAYTGAQGAGLKLKAAADAVGKPIYLELSAVNPVVFLPGAIEERGSDIAGEFVGSCLVGTGQFCTNPGLIVLIAGESTDKFLGEVTAKFGEAPVGTLLSPNVESSLKESLQALVSAGADKLTEDSGADESRCCHSNTLLKITGDQFLSDPVVFQTEAFGNSSLAIVASDIYQAQKCLEQLEGSLTACVYSHTGGNDDAAYDQLAPALRARAGRLLNDKMPTGVAVSPAMNHGGPFPATGHPNFTAVGIPTSLRRFAMLQCFDNVRPHRLPAILQDKNPNGTTWRYIDGNWSQADA